MRSQRILRCQGECELIRPCRPFGTDAGQLWLCIDCCPIDFPSADDDAGAAVAADGGDAVHGE